jgi:formamidopyrimidine-DNA glycosylase
MPELPEVETVKETLKPLITGKTVEKTAVYYEKMVMPETKESFNQLLKNQILNTISRYGKYLLFEFTSVTLLVHLRMEGKFYVKEARLPKEKHEHVTIFFTDGTSLRYHDVRKFGTLTLKVPDSIFDNPPLNKLGYEPHHPNLTKTYLKQKFKTTRSIKTVLLDQTIILGLGNIYVDEVLFCAKINPLKPANKLTTNQCETIIHCAGKIIDKAIELGGSSIRTYLNSLGISGKFQNELTVHLRANEPCIICENPIKKIKVGGRGTYYCSHCQK